MVMNINKELPKRKRNRLENYDYSSCGAYFITICTKDRKNIFWEKERHEFVGEDIILPHNSVKLSLYGKIAENAIKTIPKHYPHIELMQYVVMPNHIHMILLIPYDGGRMISSTTDETCNYPLQTRATSILTVIGQMKRCVSKTIGKSIWQRSFHDHVIRDKNDYEKIANYIYENPMKWQYDCFFTEE